MEAKRYTWTREHSCWTVRRAAWWRWGRAPAWTVSAASRQRASEVAAGLHRVVASRSAPWRHGAMWYSNREAATTWTSTQMGGRISFICSAAQTWRAEYGRKPAAVRGCRNIVTRYSSQAPD